MIKYKFGPAKKAFAEASGRSGIQPALSRHSPASLVLAAESQSSIMHTSRAGSLGYTFGNWYAKATYETRYFKFVENAGNPSNLYNWKSNLISGGIGVSF